MTVALWKRRTWAVANLLGAGYYRALDTCSQGQESVPSDDVTDEIFFSREPHHRFKSRPLVTTLWSAHIVSSAVMTRGLETK